MYFSKINPTDIANGDGVRVTLFVSGCRNHCPNCFQPETWKFNYGTLYDFSITTKILKYLKPEYITGLTILGGEPFEPENIPELIELCKSVKAGFPQKSIWIYSGYTYETLIKRSDAKILLSYVDVLVDGPFIQSQHKIDLKFKGSSNQRVIDLNKTRKTNIIKLYYD